MKTNESCFMNKWITCKMSKGKNVRNESCEQTLVIRIYLITNNYIYLNNNYDWS